MSLDKKGKAQWRELPKRFFIILSGVSQQLRQLERSQPETEHKE